MSQRVLKYIPSELATYLRRKNLCAFGLLSLIAERARQEPGHPDGLQVGQCYISDYEAAGIPTRQKYRTALTLLVKLGLVQVDETCRKKAALNSITRVNTQGTIVTFLNTGVWYVDLNTSSVY